MTITYLKKASPTSTLTPEQTDALEAIRTSLLYIEGIALKHQLHVTALGLRYAQYMSIAQTETAAGKKPDSMAEAEKCFEKVKSDITLSDAFFSK